MLVLLLAACETDWSVRCVAAAPPEDPSDPPDWGTLHLRNVLILSTDTTRRDAMGRYNGDAEATPFFDLLADEGMALDRHASCSAWTLPAVACAESGRPTEDMGWIPRIEASLDDIGGVPDDVTLLAGTLEAEGWQTRLVSANSYLGDEFGTARGYDELHVKDGLAAEGVTEAALAELADVDPTRPWLLHAHYNDAHAVYDPPAAYLGAEPELPWDLSTASGLGDATSAWERLSSDDKAELYDAVTDRYRGEVRYVDDQARALFVALNDAGWLHDTLVVVWSDHGEQFWEHGGRGHASSLHGEQNDAIALFWAEGLGHSAWTDPTTHADLAPTVLAAVGVPVPEEMTGTPVGFAAPDRVRMSVLWPKDGPLLQAADDGHVKLLYNWGGRFSMYRRDDDPCEQDDVYDGADPDALRLWHAIEGTIPTLSAIVGADPVSGTHN